MLEGKYMHHTWGEPLEVSVDLMAAAATETVQADNLVAARGNKPVKTLDRFWYAGKISPIISMTTVKITTALTYPCFEFV